MNFKNVEFYEERSLIVNDFQPYFLGFSEEFMFGQDIYTGIEKEMVDWCETWNFRNGLIGISVLQVGKERPVFDFNVDSEVGNP
jgi:hypothetical protein